MTSCLCSNSDMKVTLAASSHLSQINRRWHREALIEIYPKKLNAEPPEINIPKCPLYVNCWDEWRVAGSASVLETSAICTDEDSDELHVDLGQLLFYLYVSACIYLFSVEIAVEISENSTKRWKAVFSVKSENNNSSTFVDIFIDSLN